MKHKWLTPILLVALVGINLVTLSLRQQSISADTPVASPTPLATVAASPSPTPAQTAVKGVIVLKDNTPMVGTVTLGAASATLAAKDNGKFALQNVTPGAYTLVFTTPAGKVYKGNVLTVEEGLMTLAGTQVLEPAE